MKRRANPTGRDADPRRTIPLNSAAWCKLRALVLNEEPLCRECQRMGRVTLATDVDHHDGDPGNNNCANLVPLCHACHSQKTMRERHGKIGVLGCGLDGVPLDPNHHWKTALRGCIQATEAFIDGKSPETEQAKTGRSLFF